MRYRRKPQVKRPEGGTGPATDVPPVRQTKNTLLTASTQPGYTLAPGNNQGNLAYRAPFRIPENPSKKIETETHRVTEHKKKTTSVTPASLTLDLSKFPSKKPAVPVKVENTTGAVSRVGGGSTKGVGAKVSKKPGVVGIVVSEANGGGFGKLGGRRQVYRPPVIVKAPEPRKKEVEQQQQQQLTGSMAFAHRARGDTTFDSWCSMCEEGSSNPPPIRVFDCGRFGMRTSVEREAAVSMDSKSSLRLDKKKATMTRSTTVSDIDTWMMDGSTGADGSHSPLILSARMEKNEVFAEHLMVFQSPNPSMDQTGLKSPKDDPNGHIHDEDGVESPRMSSAGIFDTMYEMQHVKKQQQDDGAARDAIEGCCTNGTQFLGGLELRNADVGSFGKSLEGHNSSSSSMSLMLAKKTGVEEHKDEDRKVGGRHECDKNGKISGTCCSSSAAELVRVGAVEDKLGHRSRNACFMGSAVSDKVPEKVHHPVSVLAPLEQNPIRNRQRWLASRERGYSPPSSSFDCPPQQNLPGGEGRNSFSSDEDISVPNRTASFCCSTRFSSFGDDSSRFSESTMDGPAGSAGDFEIVYRESADFGVSKNSSNNHSRRRSIGLARKVLGATVGATVGVTTGAVMLMTGVSLVKMVMGNGGEEEKRKIQETLSEGKDIIINSGCRGSSGSKVSEASSSGLPGLDSHDYDHSPRASGALLN